MKIETLFEYMDPSSLTADVWNKLPKLITDWAKEELQYYLKTLIPEEIKNVETGGEEARLDGLWLKTNRAIDYITLVIFRHGYAEINSKGFNFTKKEEPIKETK